MSRGCGMSEKRSARRWRTVVDLDLRVKPRDADASIRVALRDVRCSRCNGRGGPRILALALPPSV
jgi:hypothetical protein